MPEGDFEVVNTGDGWRVVVQKKYSTQEEAWAVANHLARVNGRESFLRGLNGRWRKRNTFPRSRDPKRTRG